MCTSGDVDQLSVDAIAWDGNCQTLPLNKSQYIHLSVSVKYVLLNDIKNRKHAFSLQDSQMRAICVIRSARILCVLCNNKWQN